MEGAGSRGHDRCERSGHAPGPARRVGAPGGAARTDSAAAAAPPIPDQHLVDRVGPCAACRQPVHGYPRDAGSLPGPHPLQPVFPQPGQRRPRQGHHVEGHGGPRYFHRQAVLRRLEAHDRVQDGDPYLRRPQRPVRAATAQGGGRQRRTDRHRFAVVADPAAELPADDLVHRAAVLADAACRERFESPRLVRALEGAPISAVR